MAGRLAFLSPRIGRGVAIVAVVVYLLGTLISLVLDEPSIFQRFGSLGVAAAILFFTDRLMQIELNRQKTVERILHEYGLELGAMKEGTDPKDIPIEGYVIDYLTEERGFDRLRERAERITIANTILLTLATLQWGFGDLLVGGIRNA